MDIDGKGFRVRERANGNAVERLHEDMWRHAQRVGIEKPDKVTAHDLRPHILASTVTKLKFTREAMDRLAEPQKKGVGRIYDRHVYDDAAGQVHLGGRERVPACIGQWHAGGEQRGAHGGAEQRGAHGGAEQRAATDGKTA